MLGSNIAVAHLLHQHDFLFFRCNEHQHTGRKIAALEGVLPVEGQRAQVGHVRIKQDERYLLLMQLVGKLACRLKSGRHDDDAVGLQLYALYRCLLKGLQVEPLIIDELYGDAEVATVLAGGYCSFLNFLPVCL